MRTSPIERFIRQFRVNDETGCWEWTGKLRKDGYAEFHAEITMRAHRFAYVHHIGTIPEGMQIDHLCRNRSCVNPDHLEAVTHAENMRRSARALLTHCPHGHPYDDENTYRPPRGGRECRICREARHKIQVATREQGVGQWRRG